MRLSTYIIIFWIKESDPVSGPKAPKPSPLFPLRSFPGPQWNGGGTVVSGPGPTAFMVRSYLHYLLLNYVGLLYGGPCSVANWPIVRPHKSKRGPNKKWSSRTNLRPNFGRFCTQRGRTSRKCILTSLFTLILGKFKKYYNVATNIDKDNFFCLKHKCLKKNEDHQGGRIFSSAAEFFLSSWPESSAKSWQH
jgi:hypothetical protein